jgi:hypothetical protein
MYFTHLATALFLILNVIYITNNLDIYGQNFSENSRDYLYEPNNIGFNNTAEESSIYSSDTIPLGIVFESILIREDHDPLNSGEWNLAAYINDNKLVLLDDESVDEGKKISFNNSKDMSNFLGERKLQVNVPKNGELIIQIYGFERDGGKGALPTLDSPGTVGDIYGAAKKVIEGFLSVNDDDGTGIIADRYDKSNNFGIRENGDGRHTVLSLFNNINEDSTNDYEIVYDIQEIH